jgi:Ca-activated chloride channel family protein
MQSAPEKAQSQVYSQLAKEANQSTHSGASVEAIEQELSATTPPTTKRAGEKQETGISENSFLIKPRETVSRDSSTATDLFGAPLPLSRQEDAEPNIFRQGRNDLDTGLRSDRLLAPGLIKEFRGTPLAHNTESYGDYQENVPTLVRDTPVSTFSIDVDTGSYTNARRFLKMGSLPPTNAIRVEEFLNYFDYNYISPQDEPFALNYEVAPNPFDNEKYLLRLGLKAREINNSEKPWNLVFLIDVSGSMNSPDKLPLLKRSLSLLASNMRAEDKVSIVTYAGHAGVALRPSGREKLKEIRTLIESLRFGGGTNGGSGLELAYSLAKESFIKGGVNRIVLATDGDFNIGNTNFSSLIEGIENRRESGVSLTTIGVGTGNIQENLLEQLANKGNGNYFYLDSFREARKVFEEELAGTLETVAQDVKLQLEFNPALVTGYRLIGYENRKLRREDFSNDKIDAGEIGAGHRVTALYELVLNGTEAAKRIEQNFRYGGNKIESIRVDSDAQELGFLKVRYKSPGENQSQLLEFPLKKASLLTLKETSKDFNFAASVSAFAHKLRKSEFAPEASFSEIATRAEAALGNDKSGYRKEFVELVRNVKHLD